MLLTVIVSNNEHGVVTLLSGGIPWHWYFSSLPRKITHKLGKENYANYNRLALGDTVLHVV